MADPSYARVLPANPTRPGDEGGGAGQLAVRDDMAVLHGQARVPVLFLDVGGRPFLILRGHEVHREAAVPAQVHRVCQSREDLVLSRGDDLVTGLDQAERHATGTGEEVHRLRPPSGAGALLGDGAGEEQAGRSPHELSLPQHHRISAVRRVTPSAS